MSVSQQEAALITENRELRERLQGALDDLRQERERNARAAEAHVSLDLRLQQVTREKRALLEQLERIRGGR